MPVPTVRLKPQHPDRIGHSWVYDNEVASGPPPGVENGAIVRVVDSRGKTLGTAFSNAKSKIYARYLTRQPDTVIDDDFWRRRVRAAVEYRRRRYASNGALPPAFRAIYGEADGIPGLVADIYPGYAVVQFLALGLEAFRTPILETLAQELSLLGIYERSDSHVRKLEGLDEQTGAVLGDEPPDRLEWDDDGVILADIKHGAKTGLFLDQRENQAAVARESIGRNVLNCFSYTGLFGLRAARAGARSITDIEMSAPFNALNKEQWALNAPAATHAVVTENVFDYLRRLEGDQYKTDMIILDPPAFTKSRASRAGAVRGYNEINRTAIRLLNPGGVLVTCSCSHHLERAEFREIVAGAAHDAGRSMRVISERGQPADHPILFGTPETEYLKCLTLAAD